MNLNITNEEREGLKNTFANFKREKSQREIFYDLCFCICAPQTKFVNNRKVTDELIRRDFFRYDIKPYTAFEELLKPTRFYHNKARYLTELKKSFKQIFQKIDDTLAENAEAYVMREWLIKNVKGLGMKTASHFLRNLGDDTLAIIDTHILKFLMSIYGKFWKNLKFSYPSKNEYLLYEAYFQDIAKQNDLTTAELDALIWQRYSKTPWENFKF